MSLLSVEYVNERVESISELNVIMKKFCILFLLSFFIRAEPPLKSNKLDSKIIELSQLSTADLIFRYSEKLDSIGCGKVIDVNESSDSAEVERVFKCIRASAEKRVGGRIQDPIIFAIVVSAISHSESAYHSLKYHGRFDHIRFFSKYIKPIALERKDYKIIALCKLNDDEKQTLISQAPSVNSRAMVGDSTAIDQVIKRFTSSNDSHLKIKLANTLVIAGTDACFKALITALDDTLVSRRLRNDAESLRFPILRKLTWAFPDELYLQKFLYPYTCDIMYKKDGSLEQFRDYVKNWAKEKYDIELKTFNEKEFYLRNCYPYRTVH